MHCAVEMQKAAADSRALQHLRGRRSTWLPAQAMSLLQKVKEKRNRQRILERLAARRFFSGWEMLYVQSGRGGCLSRQGCR